MKVLFRADASRDIGIGHVMRCFALAQALRQRKHHIIFLMLDSTPVLEERLIQENIDVKYLAANAGSSKDIKTVITLSNQLNVDWVVVDGYQFNTNYQRSLKQTGLKVLFFDDYGHGSHYYADLILNQNLNADIGIYARRERYTKLLLGCSYSLLRQEFLEWENWQRKIPSIARKVLVTLGGADPDNVTLKVLKALQLIQVHELQVLVVIGSNNPHYERLQKIAQQMTNSIRLIRNANNMPELMAWADVAIAAGGSTNWELAFMGLPTIVLVIANNQQEIVKELERKGVVVNLGWHTNQTVKSISKTICSLLDTSHQRQSMSQTARKLIDGKGGQRVIKKMEEIFLYETISES